MFGRQVVKNLPVENSTLILLTSVRYYNGGELERTQQSEDRVRMSGYDPHWPKISFQESEFWSHKDDKYKDIDGSWILFESDFKDWLRYEFPVLWICGLPGTGKSYLAYHLVQTLRQMERKVRGKRVRASISYFFCKSENQTDPRSLLGEVIIQLASQDPEYLKYLETLPWQHIDHDVSSLWSSFIFDFFAAGTSSSATIVVYGIENMRSDRRRFFTVLGSLKMFSAGSEPNVSFILLSNYDIGEEFESEASGIFRRIEITPEKTKGDIAAYIRLKVQELKGLRKRRDIRRKVTHFLQSNANGSYLWVNSMIKECPQDELSMIENWIQQPPKQWYEVFEQGLKALEEGLKPYQIDTLKV